MHLIITRTFPPDVGGMQNLMWGLARTLSKFFLIKVFADHTNGFEKFDNLYVRIDILERLFLMIFNTKSEDKNKEIKLIPEMLNLLGCNKENFVKLIKKMNYKTYEKDNNLHFKYIPSRKVIKKDTNKNINDNPFNVLSQLNLK